MFGTDGQGKRVKMLIILLLKLVQVLLFPISALFAGIDNIIAPLLSMAGSIERFNNFYIYFLNGSITY